MQEREDAISCNEMKDISSILSPLSCKSLIEEAAIFQNASLSFGKLDFCHLTHVCLISLQNCEGVCGRYVVKAVEEGC